MIIRKETTYRKRLVISQNRIIELDSILEKYCERIRYKATTDQGTSLAFEDRDELLKYDNFKNGKTISLDVSGESKDRSTSIEITIAPTFKLKDETARCRYEFSDNDKERLFVDDWTTFLKKCTEYQISYTICKVATFVFWLSLGVYFLVRFFNTKLRDLSYYPLLFILMFSFIKTVTHDKTIWDRVFPPAVFPWGEEREKNLKRINIRSQLFWAVVIPTAISIAFEIVSIIRMAGTPKP
ncbi:MAG: hypothetical protein II897_02095 [Clostridia bacterium]|nr:hypothetical protein [Clostridia bacterium]